MSNKTNMCPACRRKGHKLDAVVVETTTGFRNLRYCICCGEPLKPEKDSRAPARFERLRRKSKISQSRHHVLLTR